MGQASLWALAVHGLHEWSGCSGLDIASRESTQETLEPSNARMEASTMETEKQGISRTRKVEVCLARWVLSIRTLEPP